MDAILYYISTYTILGKIKLTPKVYCFFYDLIFNLTFNKMRCFTYGNSFATPFPPDLSFNL